jgi:phospholipid transport system substrate-binding protein
MARWAPEARRWRCCGAVLAVLVLGLATTATAGGPATEAIKRSIDAVIKILEDPEFKKAGRQEERRHLLETTIGERFNYEEMSKRTLPGQWNKLSDGERKEFVSLFQRLLSNSYSGRIEGYSGEQVHYLNERRDGDFAEVRTKVTSGKAEIPLDYRLTNKSGDWRVYDVVVDGVSLVNNYRGQFTKILKESSYADLVKQLREKAEKKPEPPPS